MQLIFDFETMSACSRRAAAIDIAAFVFDPKRFVSDDPYDLDLIDDVCHWKLSVKDQVETYGYEVSSETVDWWLKQDKTVRDRIKPKSSDMTVIEFVKSFQSYLQNVGKLDIWWSRSNTFDPIILERLYESVDKLKIMNNTLKHFLVRDTRSYIDAKFDFNTRTDFCPIQDQALWERTFKQHDCRWDIVADILRMQTIKRAEEGLSLI